MTKWRQDKNVVDKTKAYPSWHTVLGVPKVTFLLGNLLTRETFLNDQVIHGHSQGVSSDQHVYTP